MSPYGDTSEGRWARSKRRNSQRLRPSDASLAKAEAASRRVRGRLTRIRRDFIVRHNDVDAPSALATLLRGGRGGPLRLKLYLALLWMAGKPPHDVSYPARAWAELLDLSDPSGRGERRVREALAWLEAHHFVRSEASPGRPRKVFLLREDGSHRPYTVPASLKAGEPVRPGDRYVRLPASFWTNGWAITLSGPGLAVLLALLVITQGGDKPKAWVAPSRRRQMFDLSEDTWTRGVSELRDLELLDVARVSVGRDKDFDWRRLRNAYTLNLVRLDQQPSWASQEQD